MSLQTIKSRSAGALRLAAFVTLSAACLAPSIAQASEVVKLARLVITGKRASAEPTLPRSNEAQSVQQLPRVLVEGHSVRPDTAVSYSPMGVLFGSRPIGKSL